MISKVENKAKELGMDKRLTISHLNYTEIEKIEKIKNKGKKTKNIPKFDIIFADFGYNQSQIENLPGLSYLSKNMR